LLKKGYNEKSFNAMMKHPVGPEWIPRKAHRALTQPRVTTVPGAVIDPINKKMVRALIYHSHTTAMGRLSAIRSCNIVGVLVLQ